MAIGNRESGISDGDPALFFVLQLEEVRRRWITRGATALLVVVLAVAGLRAAPAAACCDDDCAQPCCSRDRGHASVVPVLPCCRTVSLHEAAPQPAPTVLDADHGVVAAPLVVAAAPLVVAVPARVARATVAPRLRAPPLYRQHCALLL